MYAVLVDGVVAYIGPDSAVAAEVLLSKGATASMVTVSSLDELAELMARHGQSPEEDVVEGLSRAASRLFKMLDESGVNVQSVEKATETLRSKSEQAITQVRSLGIKGMKTVGEGFIALGDLLRKAGDEPETPPEK